MGRNISSISYDARLLHQEYALTHLPRLQKTSGGSTASSSEDELGGDGDDAFEAIAAAADVTVAPRAGGEPTLAADAADDGCIEWPRLKLRQS